MSPKQPSQQWEGKDRHYTWLCMKTQHIQYSYVHMCDQDGATYLHRLTANHKTVNYAVIRKGMLDVAMSSYQ